MRSFIGAVGCLATLLVGCGTSTTVDPPHVDAGCGDAGVVLDGGGEIDPPEAGAPSCPSGVCNYQTQDGCTGGQACRPQFSATSTDVAPGCEASGSGHAGATCATGADCAAGYFCAANVCRKQCCAGDRSACDSGESCFRELEVKAGGVVTDSGMELCFPVNNCDPFDASTCAAGTSCVVIDATGAVACLPSSNAQPGDSCGESGACAAGGICVEGPNGTPSTCRALCRAVACGKTSCEPGQGLCIHYARDPAGVGECTPE